jgi:uncharacterized protein YbaR (Trm112 family)
LHSQGRQVQFSAVFVFKFGHKTRGTIDALTPCGGIMIPADLVEILRCPACAKEHNTRLDFVKDTWLVCTHCGRKYPVVEDIPVMLIDEGDKWVSTAVDALPVPPPEFK